LFGLLNLRTHTLVFANAGHPAPLLATPHETVYLEYPQSDLPLGIEDPFMPALREVNVPHRRCWCSTPMGSPNTSSNRCKARPNCAMRRFCDQVLAVADGGGDRKADVSHRFESRRRGDPHAWTPVGPGPNGRRRRASNARISRA